MTINEIIILVVGFLGGLLAAAFQDMRNGK